MTSGVYERGGDDVIRHCKACGIDYWAVEGSRTKYCSTKSCKTDRTREHDAKFRAASGLKATNRDPSHYAPGVKVGEVKRARKT